MGICQNTSWAGSPRILSSHHSCGKTIQGVSSRTDGPVNTGKQDPLPLPCSFSAQSPGTARSPPSCPGQDGPSRAPLPRHLSPMGFPARHFQVRGIILSSSVRPADRMYWGKINDVEAHLLNVRKSFFAVPECRALTRNRSLGSMEHLIPSRKSCRIPIDDDLERPMGFSVPFREYLLMRSKNLGCPASAVPRLSLASPISRRDSKARNDLARSHSLWSLRLCHGGHERPGDIFAGPDPLLQRVKRSEEGIRPSLYRIVMNAHLVEHESAHPSIVIK